MDNGILLRCHGMLLPIDTHLMRADKHDPLQSHLCHPVFLQTIKSRLVDGKVIDHHVIIQSNPARTVVSGAGEIGRRSTTTNDISSHGIFVAGVT